MRASDETRGHVSRMDELLAAAPLPVLVGLAAFVVHIVVIADCGAGAPLLFPLFKRCMRPFRPTIAYERIKSKCVI